MQSARARGGFSIVIVKTKDPQYITIWLYTINMKPLGVIWAAISMLEDIFMVILLIELGHTPQTAEGRDNLKNMQIHLSKISNHFSK